MNVNQRKLVEARRLRRQRHVRKRLFGTPERPRLAIFRSSKHIYAQVINDETGTTIASASTVDPEIRKVRPPEPYKGKGIRYEGESVRRKAGKAFGSK